MSTTMSVNDTLEARTVAVRALEAEFGDLINRMRRILADTADRLSPGMLPGAYKVFTTIVRRESITLSALAEALMADKGQISRTVRLSWPLSIMSDSASAERVTVSRRTMVVKTL